MDLKEKLIDLLDEVHHKQMGRTYMERIETIADHLIANGVTVQDVPDINVGKWIPVSQKTPTEADGTVWVCLADKFPYNQKESCVNAKHDRRVTEANYSEHSKRWYKDGALFPDGDVTHWMEKLEPPKES